MKTFAQHITEAKQKKIAVIDQNGKDLGKKPVTVEVVRGKPWQVVYDGKVYSSTGKTGTNNKTGNPVIEMSTDEDERLWVADDESFINLD